MGGIFGLSAKRNPEALLSTGRRTISDFRTPEQSRNQLTNYLSKLVAELRLGEFETTEQIQQHARLLEDLTPARRAICSVEILRSVGKLVQDTSLGPYYCHCVATEGLRGVLNVLPRVLDQEDREIAAMLVGVLDTTQEFTQSQTHKAQAIYAKGHLEYQVLGGSERNFAQALSTALIVLASETDAIKSLPGFQQQKAAWEAMLARATS